MIINILLGRNESQEFVHSLPQISIKRLLLYFFLTLLTAFLTAFLLFGIVSGFNADTIEDAKSFILIGYVFYIPLLFFSVRYFYTSFADLKQQLISLKIKDVLKHVGIIAFFLYTLLFLLQTINFLIQPEKVSETINSFETDETESPLIFGNPFLDILVLIPLWLLVGVSEELFFRGGLYRVLRKRLNIIIALLLSSAIFTAAHFSQEPLGLIFVFLISLIYALYFEYKNNLLTVIILHFIHDAFGAGLLAYGSALFSRYLLH